MLANPNSGRLRCPMPSQFLHPSSPKCILFPNCSRSLPCFTSSKSKFCAVALLLPRKNGKGFGSRALAEPQVSVGAPQGYPQPFSVKIPIGDRHILVETGHIGRQSSAAVIVTDGKTIFRGELAVETLTSTNWQKFIRNVLVTGDIEVVKRPYVWVSAFLIGQSSWLISTPVAQSRDIIKTNAVYEIGEFFELGIQLSYLLLLLGFLGIGTFFVIRQVLVRRELDLSAKELQEQVRSGDANATELFELGAVMLRRKVYPAATKYLVQAIENWDGDDQDLAQVYNALGVSYVRDGKLSKGIKQFETAVKLQPGYVTAWNNLGDAYEQKKDYKAALNAFEEVLLFDPNNKVAQPRRDALKDQVKMYRDVPVKTKER